MKLLIILLTAALSTSLAQAAQLKKCVDDKGRVYYGDSIPAEIEAKCRSSSEMTSRGMEKKKTVYPTEEERLAQEEAIEKGKAEEQKLRDQKRRDQALLLSYSNEKEIDLAKNRNLISTQAQIDGTQLRIKTIQGRLDGLNKQRDDYTRSKRPIPGDLHTEIGNAESEIQKLKNNLARHQQDQEAVKARFEEDKKRFRELKGLPPAGTASPANATK